MKLRDACAAAPEIQPALPKPIILQTTKARAYPVESLGPLRDAVEAVQERSMAPVALCAQSALAAASLSVQGFADIETLGGVRPVSIYALSIAGSGERKSASYAPFMDVIKQVEREAMQAHRTTLGSWRNRHAIWKGRRDSILGTARQGSGALDATNADLDALGPEPVAPPLPYRLANEPTYEGLIRLFAEGAPSLGVFSDEAGQFLGGFGMKSENRLKTMAGFNDLWQGNEIRRTRQGEGSSTLYDRRLAMHLMVQPEVFDRFAHDPLADASGFLPRCLICAPESMMGTRFHRLAKADDPRLEAFAARLRTILERPLPMDAETRDLKTRRLPLSPDAFELVKAYHDTIERQLAPGGELVHVAGHASKTAEMACRIAGVLALVDDLDAPEVDRETMASGIAIAQYHLAEVRHIITEADISEKIRQAEQLRRWILHSWPETEILPSDVQQKAPTKDLRKREVARSAIEILVSHGWLIPLPKGTEVRGGKRKEAFQIVRTGHVV